jgi:hypothetical protein
MGNMKTDHFYAEMLEMMRSQGSKDNPTTIQLGVMQSSTSIKIDDLVLTREDLYVSDHLVGEGSKGLQRGDLVAVQVLTNNKYLILGRVVSV